ncbi:hypothetical protein LTS08_000947 [Lithohypha guttulata]|nr:hypothetical protein LTS08_000947 [Lithohypha guttulata]
MRVLDPQSALLTNAEVYQFLKTKKPGVPEAKSGAYPSTNLHGQQTILKDVSFVLENAAKFNSYTEEVTSHVKTQPDVNSWISELVKKLKAYGLTKTEALNLINIGVGMRPSGQDQVNGDDEQEVGPDDEAEMARDVQFFKVVVEEADERFPGDDGDERIRDVIITMKSCVSGHSSND